MTKLLTIMIAVLAMTSVQAQTDLPFEITEVTRFDEPWSWRFCPTDASSW